MTTFIDNFKNQFQKEYWIWIFPLLFVLLNLILKFITVDHASIYLDESVSIFYCQQGIPEMMEYVQRDASPPLYYSILHYWIGWFGIDTASVRGLSVIFSSLTAGFIFFFARKHLNLITAFVATALFTFSNLNFHFAQEVRGYALLVMLCTLSFFLLIAYLNTKKWKLLIPLAIVNALLLYTHYTAVIALIAQVVGLILLYGNRFKLLWPYAVAGVASLLTFIPELMQLNDDKFENTSKWLHAPELSNSLDLAEYMLQSSALLWISLSLILISSVLLIQQKKWENAKQLGLLFCWGYGSILIGYGMSQWVPMFTARYMQFALTGIFVCTAYSIAMLPLAKSVRGIAMLGIIVPFLFQFNMHQSKAENWKSAVEFVHYKNKTEQYTVFTSALYHYRSYAYYHNRDYFRDPKNTIKKLGKDKMYFMKVIDEKTFDYINPDKLIFLQSHQGIADPQNLNLKLLRSKYRQTEQHKVVGIKIFVFEK
jgi:hypothetical protein